MQKTMLVAGGVLVVGAAFLFLGKGTDDAAPNGFSVGIGESDSGVDIAWSEPAAPEVPETPAETSAVTDSASDVSEAVGDTKAEPEPVEALLGDFFEDNYEDGERQIVGQYRDPLADNPSSGEVQRVGEYKHPDVDGF
jgi:hypothetical protein